jgi:hypothetical protein
MAEKDLEKHIQHVEGYSGVQERKEEEEVQVQLSREMLTESKCPVLLQWTNMSL